MAAVVPIVTGVVLWFVTGSILALCFAAMGPLMLVASLVDSARTRRRDRRQGEAQAERDWVAAEAELAHRHGEERDALWLHRPDAASCLTHPPLRGVQPPDATTPVVVGSGTTPSDVRCVGGDDPRGRRFRELCAVVADAPVVVPLGGGICLRGARPLTVAVARALVAQLCLRFGASQLSVVGGDLAAHGVSALPHAVRARRGGFLLGIGTAGGSRVNADAMIWLAAVDGEVPDGITTVIDVLEPGCATLRTARGRTTLAVECLSHAQAEEVARELAHRDDDADGLPDSLLLRDLTQPLVGEGLAAVIGRGEDGDLLVDIVTDGPHAVVTGTTGTGKSELLVSWVAAIAAENGPERVTFVLADFKGGTAFEPLRELRQVAAIITDLDEDGARRGVTSLTAELRHREAVLAEAGVRDVRDVALPRLVIVVDEFAALLAEHPDLGAVFTDVAARGRALGMHLILGTQRAAGVVRDGLAANCPLRISLRVADAADSRFMIGTDAASALPGGPASRGLALVRRPADHDPVPTRIALTDTADLRSIAGRWASAAPPRSPWLPALPACIPLADLIDADDTLSKAVVLGVADVPERQSQPLELLRCGQDRGLVVLGARGSGRSTTLRAVAAQRSDACWVPTDPEAAWDLLHGWAVGAEHPPAVVLCDDLDALLASLPSDYGQSFLQLWEQVLRAAPGTLFALTATRAVGPLSRVFDLLPRRALLRMPTRVEHLAAGGEAAGFVRDRPPGRAVTGDREVQIAWVDEDAVPAPIGRAHAVWVPTRAFTAVVTAGAGAVVTRLRPAHPDCDVVAVGEEPTTGGRSVIAVGDAETWQRNWASWQSIRSSGEVLIRAEQPAELRQLAGVRELPPYARPHAGRAWSVIGAGSPRRVVLAELLP